MSEWFEGARLEIALTVCDAVLATRAKSVDDVWSDVLV